ncbi:hypothetical protein [Acinetobacter phage Abp95]|nr:hypothetical protein [Acinetobacter phage Abp95]
MNCQEVKKLLADKDNEVKSKKEKSIEYFELIKEDILDLLIKKHIDSNFEYDSYSIYDSEFIEILLNKVDVNLSKYDFKIWGLCTTSMTIHEDFLSMSSFSMKDFNNSKNNERSRELFLSGFDSNYLINLIVNFLKKKGFEQRSGVNRFTDKKVYFFSFKITRQKLQSLCCDHSEQDPEKENQDLGIVLFGIVIFCLLAFLLMINL